MNNIKSFYDQFKKIFTNCGLVGGDQVQVKEKQDESGKPKGQSQNVHHHSIKLGPVKGKFFCGCSISRWS